MKYTSHLPEETIAAIISTYGSITNTIIILELEVSQKYTHKSPIFLESFRTP